jgi:hypothetical protein
MTSFGGPRKWRFASSQTRAVRRQARMNNKKKRLDGFAGEARKGRFKNDQSRE